MTTVGIVYLALGILLRLQAVLNNNVRHRTMIRFSRLFLAIGSLEIMLAITAFFYPSLRLYRMQIGGGLVVLFCLLVLPEMNKSYRAYRDYIDKMEDQK